MIYICARVAFKSCLHDIIQSKWHFQNYIGSSSKMPSWQTSNEGWCTGEKGVTQPWPLNLSTCDVDGCKMQPSCASMDVWLGASMNDPLMPWFKARRRLAFVINTYMFHVAMSYWACVSTWSYGSSDLGWSILDCMGIGWLLDKAWEGFSSTYKQWACCILFEFSPLLGIFHFLLNARLVVCIVLNDALLKSIL